MTDLEELVLKCRNKNAKELIAEAVTCYKAGAYRSAIVSAWNAVAYDFVAKLRELELTGDANAREKLALFERHIRANNYKGLLEYERQVLSWARDEFQFITHQEFEDLDRLRNDRHRCAHPSMLDAVEVFTPPAELARLHIRSAVIHMLQHPPVQGKAALDLIWQKVSSPYFPDETQAAKVQLTGSPLRRARPSLVRSVVTTLLKSLINPDRSPLQIAPLAAALDATTELYPALSLGVIEAEINRLIDACTDSGLNRVVAVLAKMPSLLTYTNSAVTNRLKHYVEKYDGDVQFEDGSHGTDPDEIGDLLASALRIPSLRDEALKRAQEIPDAILQRALEYDPNPDLVKVFIERFREVESYSGADRLVDNGQLARIAPYVSAEQLASLILSFVHNSQLNGSGTVQVPLSELIKGRADLHPQIKDLIKDDLSITTLYRGLSVSHLGVRSARKFVELLQTFLPSSEMVMDSSD